MPLFLRVLLKPTVTARGDGWWRLAAWSLVAALLAGSGARLTAAATTGPISTRSNVDPRFGAPFEKRERAVLMFFGSVWLLTAPSYPNWKRRSGLN